MKSEKSRGKMKYKTDLHGLWGYAFNITIHYSLFTGSSELSILHIVEHMARHEV